MTRIWNSIVTDADHVYVVGDFSLDRHPETIKSYLNKLKGSKHLILGNHDLLKPFDYVDCGFVSVHTALKIGKYTLVHDPSAAVTLSSGDTLIHGHVHTLWKDKMADNGVRLINAGVDVWDFKPVDIEVL